MIEMTDAKASLLKETQENKATGLRRTNIEDVQEDSKKATKQGLRRTNLDDFVAIDVANGASQMDCVLEKGHKLIDLTWRNITVNAPVKKGPFSLFRKFKKKDEAQVELKEKLIINNVDGIARSKEVLAIMGASGAGKTTLLNVLNFRNSSELDIQGEVRVNEQLVTSVEEIASISGYVQQDDLFIGCMTVRENLIFQAMLRMDKKYTNKERYKRVEEVMQDLNLKKCENTPIQIADQKGISGGEKRRLAFASEILTDPMILFCDEPTSGLDSFMAMSVVESMKSLAKKGKTIVCTIHQPSSEIFEMFDKLCLLAEGRQAFIGTLPEAYDYFNSQGYRVPYNYNPADFYIKNLAIVPANREVCLKRVNEICDGFEKTALKQDLVKEIDSSKKIHDDHVINFENEIRYKSNIFTQMKWLLWRNMLSIARNPMALRVQIIQSVVIALIFGLIYFQLKTNQKGVQNISGVLFLCLTNMSFGSLFVVVNTFPSEIPIFQREHQNRMYMVLSYYLSKVFLDLPIFIIQPTIFVTIIYWMANLSDNLYNFFITLGMIILVAQTSVAFGTFLSVSAPNTNAAIALAGPVLVPLMIFSGFLLNSDDIPKYFLFMRYMSWFGYANENLLINQFSNLENIECDNPAEDCMKTFQNGRDVLQFYKIDTNNFYFNIMCLFILILGWRVMSFIVLLIKSRKR